jgi:hypothetical protein
VEAPPATPGQPATPPTPATPPATPPAAPLAEAPATYEFRAPEGKEYDAQLIAAYSAGAKAAGLPQEKAQLLLETMAPALAARQQEQVAALQQSWAEASKTDKRFGGDKLQENLGRAEAALEKFASPELRTLLKTTPWGDNPEVIGFLVEVGKALAGDKIITGAPPSSGGISDAKSFYDNSKMS